MNIDAVVPQDDQRDLQVLTTLIIISETDIARVRWLACRHREHRPCAEAGNAEGQRIASQAVHAQAH